MTMLRYIRNDDKEALKKLNVGKRRSRAMAVSESVNDLKLKIRRSFERFKRPKTVQRSSV